MNALGEKRSTSERLPEVGDLVQVRSRRWLVEEVEAHLEEWRTAYDYRGTGSTFRRARAIRGIYDEAAPLPDAVMPPPSKQFLFEVRRLVVQAIEASSGRVDLIGQKIENTADAVGGPA